MLLTDLELLRWQLAGIDKQMAEDIAQLPGETGRPELAGSILALTATSRFLRNHATSQALDLLKEALWQRASGSKPAMFALKRNKGRAPETALIQQVKGVLAGLTYAQKAAGMTRSNAIAWVARHIAPELQARLAGKPITAAAIEEWLDTYGGKHPPDDPGGRAFKIWSGPAPSPLTPQKFRSITSDIARMIPAR